MPGTQPIWTDCAVAVTAIIAILLSAFSLYYARASLALAQEQDRRREPKLVPELLRGDYTTDPGTGSRTYHIQLSVRNPSDSDNALARVEFRLTYLVNSDAEMTVRFQPSEGDSGEHLAIPLRIAAHETVAGWCHFHVAAKTISGNTIEKYEVELSDTHGQMISVALFLLSERRDVR